MCARRHQLAADAERDRAPLHQVDVRADVDAEPETGQIGDPDSAAVAERRRRREVRKDAAQIDDERPDARGRRLRRRAPAHRKQERDGDRGSCHGMRADCSNDQRKRSCRSSTMTKRETSRAVRARASASRHDAGLTRARDATS